MPAPPYINWETGALALAIFDLDNTLLDGDSDYLWGRFLAESGVVDGDAYDRENHRFYLEYQAGTLDIDEFLAFSLRPLAELSETDPGRLTTLRHDFMRERIEPIILPAARALLERHREAGDVLLIITATNRFVTSPIAEALEVDALLATDPEIVDGRYTGRVSGIPCFREGKVQRLQRWMDDTGYNLAESWFYSDSRNDLPLLELVTHPVAVDADETLTAHAAQCGWPLLTLRCGPVPRAASETSRAAPPGPARGATPEAD